MHAARLLRLADKLGFASARSHAKLDVPVTDWTRQPLLSWQHHNQLMSVLIHTMTQARYKSCCGSDDVCRVIRQSLVLCAAVGLLCGAVSERLGCTTA